MVTRVSLLDGSATLISSGVAATGGWFDMAGCAPERTFHAYVDGTGAVTATIIVEVSNDGGAHVEPLHTFTLSGTTTDSVSAVSLHRWKWMRARIPAGGVTGTGAVAACTVGV